MRLTTGLLCGVAAITLFGASSALAQTATAPSDAATKTKPAAAQGGSGSRR